MWVLKTGMTTWRLGSPMRWKASYKRSLSSAVSAYGPPSKAASAIRKALSRRWTISSGSANHSRTWSFSARSG